MGSMYLATPPTDPMLSQDATIVLALARTSLPFAPTRSEEAERWLRVLRMHGQVATALQALGVAESPLEGPSNDGPAHTRWQHGRRHDETVIDVCSRAAEFATRTGSDTVDTVHILFAVIAIYGWVIDHELHRRGTSRDEVLTRLAGAAAGGGVDHRPTNLERQLR